ncbi:unnamed protein product, partial [marine sediment metagenome]
PNQLKRVSPLSGELIRSGSEPEFEYATYDEC